MGRLPRLSGIFAFATSRQLKVPEDPKCMRHRRTAAPTFAHGTLHECHLTKTTI